ncbi:hypothetical protein SJAV_10100 [Sulfurisphaera javensis]|uniref:Putative peptidoglycan binding domain-containing protein n=1 Tax=Sulfurisphaera javensis TaxID=2049879 RepID=A0AAT9GQ74_9CREN
MAKEAEGKGKIYEKILRALKAGEEKGGDRRGKQSASIIVVKKEQKSEKEFDPLNVGKYIDIRVDDHKEPLKELERILNLWIATFVEEEMVNVKDYEDIISSALAKLGYKSLKEWIEINNFEGKYTGDRIGKSVLNVLISQAESLK